MPALTLPGPGVHASFLTAMIELQAEGRGQADDNSMVGREIRMWNDRWSDPAVFAEYTAWLRADAEENSPRLPGFVPSTTLWWTEGPDYLGRIAIRHRLTPGLLQTGGHIGYDVRPSARRRGHATAMLAAVLPVAAGLGLDLVLVTCDIDNTGSRLVIEHNGGKLEDQREGKLRYWITTSDAAAIVDK